MLLFSPLTLPKGLGISLEADECVLHFPHLAPFPDPIFGPRKENKIAAKRAVALKACQLLHEKGELTYRLLPKTPERLDEDELEWDDEDVKADKRAGTKKRRRYYAKQIPKALANVDLKAGLYLYRIEMVMEEILDSALNVKGKTLYRPETEVRKLGILVGEPLSNIALQPFHLFMYSGKVVVRLEFLQKIRHLGEVYKETTPLKVCGAFSYPS